MKHNARLLLNLAAFLILFGGVAALFHAVLWWSLGASEKQIMFNILGERTGLILFLLVVVLILLGVVFGSFYRRYVTGLERMRERLTVVLGPDRSKRLPESGPREHSRLAGSINQLADQRDALERDVVTRITEAKAAAEEEKDRFAALIAELSQSVIVCNVDGRILLYNNRARTLFSSSGEASASAVSLIGLGRSIFSALDRNIITHAVEEIQQRLLGSHVHPVASFVTTAPTGQLVRAQIAPVFHGQRHLRENPGTDPVQNRGSIGGYVLILDDITRRFELESQRDVLLQSLTEGARASLANIRAAVENLVEYPDMEVPQRERFTRIVREEVQEMSARLDHTVNDFADALKMRWPLEEILGVDLVLAAQRRIEQRLALPTKTEELLEDMWIKVDSFSLLQGFTYLAARLKEAFGIREVRFRLGRSGRLAHIDLIWSGAVVSTETLINWELDPMTLGGETTPLTLREVVERHDGELWFQREKLVHRSFLRVLLPTASAPQRLEVLEAPSPSAASRPEYYDFDLFRQTDETRALDDRTLAQLAFTVFDTETTGLDPSQGDEIIQIGAVRIVNGRLLKGESFEQLINPNRPIKPESVRIHGITHEMLCDKPIINHVLPRFHAFCEDTVLVAHNAAFDMRFLQMKEGSTGTAFHQPVLDTLLLSSLVHPNQESHRLEAIAERLGVNIVRRHTALGDAIVTGEVFLRMLPLLAAMGIHTLREARKASERTYYAKIKY